MTQITDHLADIELRVAAALRRSNRRPGSVTILAVSKQQSASAVREAYAAGLRHFGENYLQEALAKMRELSDLEIEWHFIGRLQSNKTRPVAEHFQWVHTIDRPKIAERLNEHRPAHAPKLNVLIQVNQAREEQKSGVAVDDLASLARLVDSLPRLELRGLMCLPPAAADAARSARLFADLRALRDRLADTGSSMDSLSMGMSKDFEVAVEQGATCVRIGSALFGSRPSRPA